MQGASRKIDRRRRISAAFRPQTKDREQEDNMEMLWAILEVVSLLLATGIAIVIWAMLPEHWQGLAIIAYIAIAALLILHKVVEWSVS